MKRTFFSLAILGFLIMIVPNLGFMPSTRKWLIFILGGCVAYMSIRMYRVEKKMEHEALVEINESYGSQSDIQSQ